MTGICSKKEYEKTGLLLYSSSHGIRRDSPLWEGA